jgi:hypothetical protein
MPQIAQIDRASQAAEKPDSLKGHGFSRAVTVTKPFGFSRWGMLFVIYSTFLRSFLACRREQAAERLVQIGPGERVNVGRNDSSLAIDQNLCGPGDDVKAGIQKFL